MIRFWLEPLPWFVTRRYLYHLDKIAHTALLALALAALTRLVGHPDSMTTCAIAAAVLYFFVGKVIWYCRHPEGLEAKIELDWFSDAALSWCVVLLAATSDGQWLGWIPTVLPLALYLYAVATRRTSP